MSLAASPEEADLLITLAMVVLNGNTLWMLLDDETHVHRWKGIVYALAQLLIAYGNASVGLYISAALLVVGATLWLLLAFEDDDAVTPLTPTG